MDQQSSLQHQEVEQEQVAVPYNPPPPPEALVRHNASKPYINGAILAVAILLGGFMLYNFVGTQLTQLAGVATSKPATVVVTPTESITPTIHP